MNKKFQQFAAYLIIISMLCLPSGNGFAHSELDIGCEFNEQTKLHTWNYKFQDQEHTFSDADFSESKEVKLSDSKGNICVFTVSIKDGLSYLSINTKEQNQDFEVRIKAGSSIDCLENQGDATIYFNGQYSFQSLSAIGTHIKLGNDTELACQITDLENAIIEASGLDVDVAVNSLNSKCTFGDIRCRTFSAELTILDQIKMFKGKIFATDDATSWTIGNKKVLPSSYRGLLRNQKKMPASLISEQVEIVDPSVIGGETLDLSAPSKSFCTPKEYVQKQSEYQSNLEKFRKGEFTNLQSLTIGGDVEISEKDILQYSKTLRKLWIRNTALIPNIPLKELKLLEILHVDGGLWSDDAIYSITDGDLANLPNLKELWIQNTKSITSKCLGQLQGLKKLTIIACDQFRDKDLGKLIDLEYLAICWSTTITNDSVRKLLKLKHLGLDLRNEQRSKVGDTALKELINLESLWLHNILDVSDDSIRSLKRLRCLSIHYLDGFHENEASSIGPRVTCDSLKQLKQLQQLSLQNVKEFKISGSLLEQLPKLSQLNLEDEYGSIGPELVTLINQANTIRKKSADEESSREEAAIKQHIAKLIALDQKYEDEKKEIAVGEMTDESVNPLTDLNERYEEEKAELEDGYKIFISNHINSSLPMPRVSVDFKSEKTVLKNNEFKIVSKVTQ